MNIQKFSLQPLQTRDFKNASVSDHTNLNNTGSTNAHTQPNSPLPSSDQFLQSTPLLSDDQTKILSGESNNELEELSNKDPLAQEAALNVAYRKIAELEERVEQLLQEKQCSCQNNGESVPNGVSMEKYREMEKTLQAYTLLIESYSFENKSVSAKLNNFDVELGRARQENMMLKVQIENILNVLNISEENKEELWEDIEDKEVYISRIEKYTDELKVSHIKVLEDVKETLNASTTKNDELCASLQQKCEEATKLQLEIGKLQLDLTNFNKTKEEVLRLTQNNEILMREIAEHKKNSGQFKVENTQLKALVTEKCNQVEDLLQNFKKKEHTLSATLQKMNLLDILFKQTTSENRELKTQIMDLRLNANPSPYYFETSTSTRKSSKTPELAKTERKDPIRIIKENNKTKSLRGDESHRKMIQFLREKKKLSEGSNSLISQALKTIRSKSPKSHPVSEELSPVNNRSQARKNRCLTEWDDESLIIPSKNSFQIWPQTTKPMSPGHQYFPSSKKSTGAAPSKSYDVSHAVEALKGVEHNISVIVNHIKSILSGFENVKVTDIIARKVTVIDQWKDRLNNLEKLYKDIVKDRTRNGSRERNRREGNVSIKDLKESFVVFRDNGYIHLK